MNFSRGHSGTKVQCESCLFSQGKTPEFTKMGEIHKLFVLALSLVWFAGATPDKGAKKSTQTFFVQCLSTTLRVMDVRAKNRGRLHKKLRFPAAPVVGRNFLTPGHSGVRVGNVRGKSGPKSLCLCCFFFPESTVWTGCITLLIRKH